MVLVILSLLTHLAVREMGKIRLAQTQKAAMRQLEEIRSAVWKAAPGGGEPTGFLVDMGRLPRAWVATNETGRAVSTLSELWVRPPGVAPFALRAATATNLVAAAKVKAALVDPALLIPCGWRGPYLRLPTGRDRLLDPWGNPFESLDDAGFARLVTTNNTPVAAGGPVERVRHLGADARPDDQLAPAEAADRDGAADLAPQGGVRLPLAVTANFVNASGPAGVTGEVRCRWYMPSGSAITGDVATVTLAGESFATFSFEGLAPGVCTLAIDVGTRKCAETSCVMNPGGRRLDLKVLVP